MKRHAAWLSLYEQRDTQNQSRNILEQQLVYTQMQAWGDVCLACAAGSPTFTISPDKVSLLGFYFRYLLKYIPLEYIRKYLKG
jgi:hypothetical protein